tara:strand:+ start:680 stop:970 length:291 start_codon:yes stop_codon:yes gene_type:complete
MKKTLTKKDLADRINTKLGYSKEEAKEFIRLFFNIIIDSVKKQKKVKLSKLGTFDLIKKNKRMGRNPKTKEPALISERKVISFKSSKVLKNKINNN